MTSSPWKTLAAELDHWPAGSIDLWLRDDDAAEPTPQLERLLGLCGQFRLNLLLAVIPGIAQPALVERLARETAVHPCQHGWMHFNHAPQGEKSAEFGAHRALPELLDDLQKGHDRLAGLFGARIVSVFVPPWNRLSPELAQGLPQAGFRVLSAFRPVAVEVPGLTILHPDIDIIDWRGGRVARFPADIATEAAAMLYSRRLRGDLSTRLGLLLHHLVHTPEAWRLLDVLLDLLTAHDAIRTSDPPPWLD